jgi:hypothetical protein
MRLLPNLILTLIATWKQTSWHSKLLNLSKGSNRIKRERVKRLQWNLKISKQSLKNEKTLNQKRSIILFLKFLNSVFSASLRRRNMSKHKSNSMKQSNFPKIWWSNLKHRMRKWKKWLLFSFDTGWSEKPPNRLKSSKKKAQVFSKTLKECLTLTIAL